MNLYLSLFVFIFAALSANAFTIELEPNSSLQEKNLSEKKLFLARDYFSPRYEGSYVNENWPAKVSFESVSITLEEFQSRILGKWKKLFTCGGRPMQFNEILEISFRLADGVYNPFVILNFETHESVSRFFLTSIGDVLQGAEEKEVFDRKTNVEFRLSTDTLVSADYSAFVDSKYSLVKIKETGELIIKIDTIVPGFEKCNSGEDFSSILVRIEDLSS